jgi:ketosteroid isomerase-like protein
MTGGVMASNADRATVLVQAIEASVAGDSEVIGDLYTEDVQAWSPAMTVSSAAELAVEFEDREDAFSDIELDISPLPVGGDQACVEWIATATHSGPLVVDDDAVIETTGRRFTLRGVTVADFDGNRIRAFRQYWDEVDLLVELDLLPDD